MRSVDKKNVRLIINDTKDTCKKEILVSQGIFCIFGFHKITKQGMILHYGYDLPMLHDVSYFVYIAELFSKKFSRIAYQACKNLNCF